MTDSQAIERREQGDALSQVLGTGNTKAMLAQVEENVKAVIDVARDRGFVRRYGESNQEFYGEPAWSLLGLTYGLVGFVEWTRRVDNGWEARAVARTRDGVDVAAAEAMCTRTEGNRRNAPEHTLRAMAQTRARRNALRSALGAALVLAGFDFPDPEAPATDEQVGLLHLLERETGLSPEEGHSQAGVESYRGLTREQASELIELWQRPPGASGSHNVPSASQGEQVPGGNPRPVRVRDSQGAVGEQVPSGNPVAQDSSTTEGRPEEPHDVVEGSGAGGEATSEQHGPLTAGSDEMPPPVLDHSLGDGPGGSTPRKAASAPAVSGAVGAPTERVGVETSPASPADWEHASKAGLTAGRALARARKRHRDKDPLFPNIMARASDLTAEQLEALV